MQPTADWAISRLSIVHWVIGKPPVAILVRGKPPATAFSQGKYVIFVISFTEDYFLLIHFFLKKLNEPKT